MTENYHKMAVSLSMLIIEVVTVLVFYQMTFLMMHYALNCQQVTFPPQCNSLT